MAWYPDLPQTERAENNPHGRLTGVPSTDYADQQYQKLRAEQGGPAQSQPTSSPAGALRQLEDMANRAYETQASTLQIPHPTHKFATGAVRSADIDYLRLDLICPQIYKALGRTAYEGAQKYGEWNWTKGMPIRDTVKHAINHLQQYLAGDYSEPHLDHAAFNIMMVLHFINQCTCHTAAQHHEMLDKIYASQQNSANTKLG